MQEKSDKLTALVQRVGQRWRATRALPRVPDTGQEPNGPALLVSAQCFGQNALNSISGWDQSVPRGVAC